MLETEIKKLTAAITRLADLMENDQPQTAEKVETEQPEPPTAEKADTPDDENEQGESPYTTDDIKSMALAISRKDRTQQKTIKAKLAEHDAKVATDLSGDGLQEVGEWLAAVKEELGA